MRADNSIHLIGTLQPITGQTLLSDKTFVGEWLQQISMAHPEQ
jgi:hypothetical protein